MGEKRSIEVSDRQMVVKDRDGVRTSKRALFQIAGTTADTECNRGARARAEVNADEALVGENRKAMLTDSCG